MRHIPRIYECNSHALEILDIARHQRHATGEGCRRNIGVINRLRIWHMPSGRLDGGPLVQRQDAAGKRGENNILQPVAQHLAGGDIIMLHQPDANLQLMQHDRGNEGLGRIDGFIPDHNVGISPSARDLAQFGHDIGIEQQHQDRSTGWACSVRFGSGKSISSAPGAASISPSVRILPVSRLYSSNDKRTCAGRPLSVMITGPSLVARFARPRS
ncbi:hypothetical protein RHECNPAF_122100123 [Rhizobium etli CNPAF512]|nr:hypothetical protein RHECNPAF_122100123 [Rhizobium etli CNPAF512]